MIVNAGMLRYCYVPMAHEHDLEDNAPAFSDSQQAPTYKQALLFWLQLGCVSFGGPAAQIAMMHKALVNEKKWLGEQEFVNGLNFCMLLPGPEAQQLATYIGWKLHGVRGAIAAGALFVLPSVLVLLALAYMYVQFGSSKIIADMLHYLMPVIVAVMFGAAVRIGKKSLQTKSLWCVAICGFVAMYFLQLSFVLVVAAAALFGVLARWLAPERFKFSVQAHAPQPKAQFGEANTSTSAETDQLQSVPAPTILAPAAKRNAFAGACTNAVCCLLLWWLPVLACIWLFGLKHVVVQQALFFSKAALVTFGGAYAVLPYVAQQAVEHFGWLTHADMMAGLLLAETTPGPLIMVVQFVGFVGGWKHAGPLPPLENALLCGLLTTWVTFLPCFLFILLAAPYVDRLHAHKLVSAALCCISAVVVGVILQLCLNFSRVAFLNNGSVEWLLLGLSTASFYLLYKNKIGVLKLLAISAILSLLAAVVI